MNEYYLEELLHIHEKYVNTKQVAEALYLTLREAMIGNVIHSGERILEERVASIFDVSRTPAREVIKRLEQEELVVYDQKYGFRVKTFSVNECADLVEAMECMRQMTARVAAETISKVNILRLSENIERSRKAHAAGLENELIPLMEEFHNLIAHSINNQNLSKCYEMLQYKYLFVMNRNERHIYHKLAVEEHAQILEALSRHDKEETWLLSVRHTENTSVRINQFLE